MSAADPACPASPPLSPARYPATSRAAARVANLHKRSLSPLITDTDRKRLIVNVAPLGSPQKRSFNSRVAKMTPSHGISLEHRSVSQRVRTVGVPKELRKSPSHRSPEDVHYLASWITYMDVPVLRNLPHDVMCRLCSRLRMEEYQPNSIVCRQGDPSDKFFVIVQGTVSVWVVNERAEMEYPVHFQQKHLRKRFQEKLELERKHSQLKREVSKEEWLRMQQKEQHSLRIGMAQAHLHSPRSPLTSRRLRSSTLSSNSRPASASERLLAPSSATQADPNQAALNVSPVTPATPISGRSALSVSTASSQSASKRPQSVNTAKAGSSSTTLDAPQPLPAPGSPHTPRWNGPHSPQRRRKFSFSGRSRTMRQRKAHVKKALRRYLPGTMIKELVQPVMASPQPPASQEEEHAHPPQLSKHALELLATAATRKQFVGYLHSKHGRNSFGELGLIYGEPRSATIKAEAYTVLVSIDQDLFREVVKDAFEQEIAGKLSALQTIPLLRKSTDEHLKKIALACVRKNFHAGSYVFKQGGAANSLYLVMRGEVALMKRTKLKGGGNSKRVRPSITVARVTPGQMLGEYAALVDTNAHKHVWSARCHTPCEVLCVQRHDLLRRLRTDIMLQLKAQATKLQRFRAKRFDKLWKQYRLAEKSASVLNLRMPRSHHLHDNSVSDSLALHITHALAKAKLRRRSNAWDANTGKPPATPTPDKTVQEPPVGGRYAVQVGVPRNLVNSLPFLSPRQSPSRPRTSTATRAEYSVADDAAPVSTDSALIVQPPPLSGHGWSSGSLLDHLRDADPTTPTGRFRSIRPTPSAAIEQSALGGQGPSHSSSTFHVHKAYAHHSIQNRSMYRHSHDSGQTRQRRAHATRVVRQHKKSRSVGATGNFDQFGVPLEEAFGLFASM